MTNEVGGVDVPLCAVGKSVYGEREISEIKRYPKDGTQNLVATRLPTATNLLNSSSLFAFRLSNRIEMAWWTASRDGPLLLVAVKI